MELTKNEKMILLILVCGIILVSATIVILQNIWSDDTQPLNNVSSKELNIGEYSNADVTAEEQVRKYGSILKSVFLGQDVQTIFNCLDEGYIKYFSVTQDTLKENLSSKHILGENLELKSYKAGSYDAKNIYIITLGNKESSISIDTVVIENSPNDYKFAFDKFVYLDEAEKNIEESEIILTLKKQVVFADSYKIEAKLTTKSDKEFVINSDNKYEVMYLKTTSSNEILTGSTILSGKELKLNNKSEYNFELLFKIPNLRMDIIDSILIKDININNESKDLEFKL